MRWLSLVVMCFAVSAYDCTCSGSISPGGPCDESTPCPGSLLCINNNCIDPDAGQPPDCVDNDNDNRGENCTWGPDCDDNDATQTGTEICDSADNDCDSMADEGVLSECGDCNPNCEQDDTGVGTDMPFDPEANESDGVSLDDDGALVLDSSSISTDYIWIANTRQGEVLKVDTATGMEVARYVTGPDAPCGFDFCGNDPSRTSINIAGDAYIANRNGSRVTKISVLGDESCGDINPPSAPDGMFQTAGPGTALNWSGGGEPVDDCILWSVELNEGGANVIRAIAAQDVEAIDFVLLNYVWVGEYDDQKIWKLNGDTGEVLIELTFNTGDFAGFTITPYGFALDGAGQLWIASRSPSYEFARIDTTRCLDEESCAAEAPCTVDLTGPADAQDDCDDAIIAKYINAPGNPYGITVDFNQNVWIATNGGSHGVIRYDPDGDVASRLIFAEIGAQLEGIGADANGFVWAASEEGQFVVGFDGDDPMADCELDSDDLVANGMDTDSNPGCRWDTSTGGRGNRGIGIDASGKVWGIVRRGDGTTAVQAARVLEPPPGVASPTLESFDFWGVAGGGVETDVELNVHMPYTYSDMTGLQLRLATNPRGYYRDIYTGCDDGPLTWMELNFEVETPTDTSVSFRARTAAEIADLPSATWVALATIPSDTSPASISDAFAAASIEHQTYLEVEAILRSDRSSTTEVITPRVLSFSVEYSCMPFIP